MANRNGNRTLLDKTNSPLGIIVQFPIKKGPRTQSSLRTGLCAHVEQTLIELQSTKSLVFHSITGVLMNPDFWRYLFVMCRALYAPMRVLRLADQKSPAMDKLYYYVIQTDQMLLKYIADAEERGSVLLTESTLEGMKSQSAGISDDDMEDESDGDSDNDDEEVPEESGDDDDSDSNEKQVSLCALFVFFYT